MKYLLLAVGLWSSCLFAAQLPPGFVEQQIVTNLDPTAMRMAPDGRIFITEKNGDVRILENGVLLPDPFVQLDVDNFNERGLSGIAFHPDFEQNNYLYFYFTVPNDNFNRILRVTANGNAAIPGSETVIFDLNPMQGTIHNGGSMHFGLDGKLYVSVGDGADGNTANSLNSLLGKILRLNDDGSIPEDNPFYNETTGNLRAIYSSGLRNSFSTAMHPTTGQYLGCDVGGGAWEEVNEFTPGSFHGWPIVEGRRVNQVVPENYRDPLYAYDHGEGCAIIACTFYAPEVATFPPQYHDMFFFSDYCQGYIKVMNPATGEIIETFATEVNRPLSLLVAPNGDMYYLERAGIGGGSMQDNTSTTNGSLWKISFTGSGAPFISVQPQDVFLPVGESASFNVLALGEETLAYQWQRNGEDIPGATDPTLILPNVQLSADGDQFQCRITNALGTVTSASATLSVTANSRPVPLITNPVMGATYQAGEVITFAGAASDPEEGALTASNLRWFIDFHHDTHTHPALENVGGISEGNFVVPRVGEVDDNVWYRIYLVAEDGQGLSQSTFVDVFPEKTTFTVATEPTGLNIIVDGAGGTAPVSTESVIGVRRNLTAPLVQADGNTLYRFRGWQNSNNGNPIYSFFAGEEPMVVAQYDVIPLFIGDGTGLTADFFNGNETALLNSGRPVTTRIDPVVDFDFGGGGPIPEVGNDQFMIRWRGEILAPITDDYTFYVTADDGVRLWIDDELIIDQWVPQPPTEAAGNISLEGGRRYRIRLDYFEAGGGAVVQMEYEGTNIPRSIVPTTQLYPDPFQDVSETFTLRLYPNPARDETTLELGAWSGNRLEWAIYDLAGRRVDRGVTNTTLGTNYLTLYLDRLASGLYYLEVSGVRGVKGLFPFFKG